jgi:chromosomal replication initiator protein
MNRAEILKRQAAAEGVNLPDHVAHYIAGPLPDATTRDLEGAMIRLIAYASLTDQPISLALAQARLAVRSRSSNEPIRLEMCVS